MRIFVLHRDFEECAQSYYDDDLLQRCLGLGQLLATAHQVHGDLAFRNESWVTSGGRRVYAPLTKTDPTVTWVSERLGNYRWTVGFYRAVLQEYQHRWGDESKRKHDAARVFEALREAPRVMRVTGAYNRDRMTQFPTLVPLLNPHDESPIGMTGLDIGDEDLVVVHRRLYAERTRRKLERAPQELHKLYTKRVPPAFLRALFP